MPGFHSGSVGNSKSTETWFSSIENVAIEKGRLDCRKGGWVSSEASPHGNSRKRHWVISCCSQSENKEPDGEDDGGGVSSLQMS